MNESRRLYEVKKRREEQLKESGSVFIENGKIYKVNGMTIIEMTRKDPTDRVKYGNERSAMLTKKNRKQKRRGFVSLFIDVFC